MYHEWVEKMGKTEFLVIAFLVAAFCSAQINVLPIEVALLADESRSFNLADYEVHDPILITSDDDFETQGWPGNGSIIDPYVIEGLWIERVYGVRSIVVSSTTVDFIIRNCYIEPDTYGIQLGLTGSVEGSILIQNNTVNGDGDGVGISLGGVINATIIQNIVYDCYAGISVSNHISTETANHVIDNNTCFDNSLYGIWCNSPDTMIGNNTCYNNGWAGIYIDAENSDNPTIINNTCYGNGYSGTRDSGIYLHAIETALVLNNTCYDNYCSGIRINSAGNGVLVINNTCINNQYGIRNHAWASSPTIYNNVLGWNYLNNSLDETVGEIGQWDDGVNAGNYWGDYNGTYPTYPIPGPAGSVDNYPFKADATAPVVEVFEDFYYEAGSTDNYVNWTPSDNHPDFYQIYRNETPLESGIWDGANISVSADGLDLGAYNFTLLVRDTCANFATSTVFVTVVDTTPPDVDNPDDVIYNEGDTNNIITWTPSDLYPAEYQILKDSVLFSYGDWNSTGEAITIIVDGLTLGEYNYTLILIDIENNTNSDTVIVTVLDGTPPILNHPDDIEYDEGEIGNSIVWNPQDSYPLNYRILWNETIIKSGSWNTTSETISISVDGLNPGAYNYTLVVYDIGGNTKTDTVIVVVKDTMLPTINHPLDIEMELGSVGYQIVWTPSDIYPASWELFQEGILVDYGLWNSSSETIEVNLEDLGLGEYNYTLAVYDISGNSVSDTVLVTVIDTTNPTLDNPDDIQYECGSTGNDIIWSPLDLKPDSYEIYRNGIMIDSGNWDGLVVQISIDGLALGSYNYTLVVYDTSGNSVSNSIVVSVVDTTDPTLSSPDDVQFKYGDLGYNLTWTLIDVNPLIYEIFMDLTLVSSGTWNSSGETVTVSLDEIPEGIHYLTIYVNDLAGNEASDMIIVTVLPDGTTTDTTTTSPPADSQFQIMDVLGLGIGFGVILSVIVFVVLRKRE